MANVLINGSGAKLVYIIWLPESYFFDLFLIINFKGGATNTFMKILKVADFLSAFACIYLYFFPR